MSWDFSLCDVVTGKILETEEKHFMKGGTYCIDGTREMSLNITGNYSDIISNAFEPYEDSYLSYAYILADKTGAESIPLLKNAINKLSDDVNDDYWKATEGNAKRALQQLLALAQIRPDGIWHVC